MKVQLVETDRGNRYLLLNDEYAVVDEVHRYLIYLESCGRSPNTLRSYAYDLKAFYEYMNSEVIPIKGLFTNPNRKPVDILSDFMLWLQYPDSTKGIFHIKGEDCKRSNKTLNHIMESVLSFYQYLASNNEIQELETYKRQRNSKQFKSFLHELIKHKKELSKNIFNKPVPEVPVEAITREQYNTIFSFCRTRRDKLLLAILYEGGLRINEALGIHICDITEIEDGIIHIVPRENNENNARVKGNSGGIIKLPDYVIDLLLDYINEDIIDFDSDFLFLTLLGKKRGCPMTSNNAEQLFDRLSKKAGFNVHPHMLRHGFATEKLEAGWQMVDIQAYLRHKNISSTQIYATYNDEIKLEKMRAFLENNAIFNGGI